MFKLHNEKSYHIIEGYDPETYYYEPMEKKYNIVFVGNATPKRIQSIKAIQEAVLYPVSVFGSGWHDPNIASYAPAYLDEERDIYNQAKVVLNLVHDDYIFSDRVVKALGCGALVMSENCKDLGKMFITMKNGSMTSLVPRFDDAEKFKVLYDMYTEHEVPAGARENVAAFIKKFYSWKASCIKVMDKVGKNYG
jgi:spore maturation protein CgeB